MSEKEEILIAAEDLEFLQDHIKALGDENKWLKETTNPEFVSKVEYLYDTYTTSGRHEGLIAKLGYIESYIKSLQEEREQYGAKLETILNAKESESMDEKQKSNSKTLELINELDKLKLIQIEGKDLKKKLIDQIEAQLKCSIIDNDAKSTGSTGEYPKKRDIQMPTIDSPNNEFINLLEKLWKEREETFNDPSTKVQPDELKKWDEKLLKMKESIQEKNKKIEQLEDEKKQLIIKVQPLSNKIESLEENEKQLRRMLNETNLLSEGYYKRIQELEAQRTALTTDVATLEEEVEVARKHATERFTLARQKQDVENKLQELSEKHKAIVTEYSELKERAKLFAEITNKRQKLEEQVQQLDALNKELTENLGKEIKEKDDLEQIRQLQDKAIRELYDNEKYLKQNIEKITHDYSDYKVEMEAKHK